MIKYNVTNLTNVEKKFRDGWLGKDIIVEPQKNSYHN